MIKRIMVALVAAAMMVAMAVPAFANHEGGDAFGQLIGLQQLDQELSQDQEADNENFTDQSNDFEVGDVGMIEADNEGGDQEIDQGVIFAPFQVNDNDTEQDIDQTQNADQEQEGEQDQDQEVEGGDA